jgi:splicing factor U2AF subunit
MDVLAQQVQQLQEQLSLKEQENQQLTTQLQHLRSWMNSLQQRARANDPHALLVARELYVGGVPEGTTEEDLCSFFNALMTCSGAQLDSGTSVLNCSITRDKGPPYAFLKMRSVQEASNALAFNGIQFRGSTLKVSRPSKYHPEWGVLLGPTSPDPTINTSMLSINSGNGTPQANGGDAPRKPANPNRLYISGLPYSWRTQHLQGMLSPFGELKDCVVIIDKMSQKSKGYGFCEFTDGSVVNGVIKSLHNSLVEGRKITVKRADDESAPPSTTSS